MLTDIKAVVDANPHEINEMSDYFVGDAPCCVIGHVIASLGGSPDLVMEEVAVTDFYLRELFASDEAVYLAGELQSNADSWMPWKEAWDKAWDELLRRNSRIPDIMERGGI
jgi:hypothetical protein